MKRPDKETSLAIRPDNEANFVFLYSASFDKLGQNNRPDNEFDSLFSSWITKSDCINFHFRLCLVWFQGSVKCLLFKICLYAVLIIISCKISA